MNVQKMADGLSRSERRAIARMVARKGGRRPSGVSLRVCKSLAENGLLMGQRQTAEAQAVAHHLKIKIVSVRGLLRLL